LDSASGSTFNLILFTIFGDIAVVKPWHFGWEMPIRANLRLFFKMLTPEIVTSLF